MILCATAILTQIFAWVHFRSSACRVQDACWQCLERGEEAQATLTRFDNHANDNLKY